MMLRLFVGGPMDGRHIEVPREVGGWLPLVYHAGVPVQIAEAIPMVSGPRYKMEKVPYSLVVLNDDRGAVHQVYVHESVNDVIWKLMERYRPA